MSCRATTYRTGGVTLEPHASPLTGQAIEGGEPSMHMPGTTDQLERFQRLEGPDDADQRRDDPALGTGQLFIALLFRRIQAAVTRRICLTAIKHRQLTGETNRGT